MYVRVRTMDGKQNVTIRVSKTTAIEHLKEMVEKELKVSIMKQRLFFRGKQLENGYNLFDYDINVNDVVQLMTKVDSLEESNKENSSPNRGNSTLTNNCSVNGTPSESFKAGEQPCESEYFKVGDHVDARDTFYGAWFEGKIARIYRDSATTRTELSENDDGLLYEIFFHSHPNAQPLLLSLRDIRPRAREIISIASVKSGDLVMVNYNIEEPHERGYWYDLQVKQILTKGRKKPLLKGTLLVGTENAQLDDCIIVFFDEIMKIELRKLITERTKEELKLMQSDTYKKRVNAPYCLSCGDNARRKCKECGCHKCGGKNDPDKQIICDECNESFHIFCLEPPLSQIPEDEEWYCKECKNNTNEIVNAGEKLKESKKKAKMRSTVNNSNRDWGKGMACVGRTKECTIVPPNHFGPIPGIEVGTTWKFRVQVSEAGVHRPPVSGIHGRENEGAYSLVLAGGYEDDADVGEEFFYTGSGGRDLHNGSRRTATKQSSDQLLTRMNKALALNCNAPLNAKKGAKSKDWKAGKPVRVVRSCKFAKQSIFAPDDGIRYDGIYKVVAYFPKRGKSGFKVWQYLLRRDDPAPPPWTSAGRARMESLGLEMLYPDGYLEAIDSSSNQPQKRSLESPDVSPPAKKSKKIAYELEPEVIVKIQKDMRNSKLWAMAKTALSSGKKEFLYKVEETFMCICCQELVNQPISTPCGHNLCLVCLQNSFNAEVYSCPTCRTQLGSKFRMVQNQPLQAILLHLFPGYTAGR